MERSSSSSSSCHDLILKNFEEKNTYQIRYLIIIIIIIIVSHHHQHQVFFREKNDDYNRLLNWNFFFTLLHFFITIIFKLLEKTLKSKQGDFKVKESSSSEYLIIFDYKGVIIITIMMIITLEIDEDATPGKI